ncbi:hypothetical protein LTR53_002752 [Teratosphaeriaceae sp. CCFEE 6253]|nr:hypothetical protein LTR53_002752 [Teratosphaeriaceae sp. CCFEE 6253]
MVKADVKHNYYTDLDLPSTCSIDEVKKQYRRLALLYHPDRNAGKEEEVVPKFQAIQTAHEVLSDPALKSKYDIDRRKAGLYPTFRPGQQTQQTPGTGAGAPYTATSAYPPPPRRTQPGTWQRAPPAATAPTGADRFANFTRGAPTARRDPTADRSSNFKAWQNLNTAQERQQQQQRAPPPSPQAPPQASPGRPRPPPRNDTKMPSEDEIRAGMNHRKPPAPPPPAFDADPTSARQTAWQAFQQSQSKAGVGRSNTTRTPKKPGFDPNAPGSDERPAGDSGYRHRSVDYGRNPSGAFPPPPPGPPPMSPTSPTATKSHADPLHPSRSHEQDTQAPYAEANRKRTPYTSFIGEKTPFARESPEGLRRTASTRDTTKLNVNGESAGRARSTSPLGRAHATMKGHGSSGDKAPNGIGGARKPFVNYSDSDMTDNGLSESESGSPVEMPSTKSAGGDGPSRPGTAPQNRTPFDRPMKVPTPPSLRRNKANGQLFNPPAQTDGAEAPGMQQKNGNNMYVPSPDPHDSVSARDGFSSDKMFAPFESKTWRKRMFGTTGTDSTLGAGRRVPVWAVPSSISPGRGEESRSRSAQETGRHASKLPGQAEKRAGPVYLAQAQEAAIAYVRVELEKSVGEVPNGLDMDVFLRLASIAHQGDSSGNLLLDKIMQRALALFPYFALHIKLEPNPCKNTTPNANRSHDNSFSFPFQQDMFSAQHAAKSRSEEQINTKFTPDGWSGQFGGTNGDYFSPPPPTGRKAGNASPGKRQKSGLRSATTPRGPPPGSNSTANVEPKGHAIDEKASAGEVKFSKEQWEKTFQDATWTWPPPPNVPASLSGQRSRVGGKKSSKANMRPASAGKGTREHPHVLDDDAPSQGDARGAGNEGIAGQEAEDDDKMDIDSTPPAQHHDKAPGPERSPTHEGAKEPRLYTVPPSPWRQQQQPQTQTNGHSHHRSTPGRLSADGGFKTNLDDLAHVEPINPSTHAAGLSSMADVHGTLPFPSQASSALPRLDKDVHDMRFNVPPVPKAPEPPSRLTKQSWHAFVNAFGAYLLAHHVFNSKMLEHFVACERSSQTQLSIGTGWLEATGDVAGGGGFGSYLRNSKEDEKVREVWALGCERHAEAVKGFEKIRERVRKLGAGGGLVDQ